MWSLIPSIFRRSSADPASPAELPAAVSVAIDHASIVTRQGADGERRAICHFDAAKPFVFTIDGATGFMRDHFGLSQRHAGQAARRLAALVRRRVIEANGTGMPDADARPWRDRF